MNVDLQSERTEIFSFSVKYLNRNYAYRLFFSQSLVPYQFCKSLLIIIPKDLIAGELLMHFLVYKIELLNFKSLVTNTIK